MTEPLTARAAKIRLAQYGEHAATYDSGSERALHEIALALSAEVDRLRGELASAVEDTTSLHRSTIPDLRRNVEHYEAGKKRWRARAERAEAERDRFSLAWKSARERAAAYGEGILRVVGEREQYAAWLKAAEGCLEVQRRQSDTFQSAANIADHALSANSYACEADARTAMSIATEVKAVLRGDR
ncbi:hypothetical protein ACIOUE_00685 [Streptomyces xanthochromogenes]|uniref:hypothetical protein n=1 Tax=Streptomyces xanthochromogenes TaxID=67384 RepID=UPI00382F405D